jgi:hypothetical protein
MKGKTSQRLGRALEAIRGLQKNLHAQNKERMGKWLETS